MKQKHDFRKSVNASYLTGVLMGINAVSDAYIVFESPECILKIAENIYLTHDILSTLLSNGKPNRVLTTKARISEMYKDRKDVILETLSSLKSLESHGPLFFCSMPVNNITSVDYKSIISSFNSKSGKKVIFLPQKSLDHDWIDGYAEVMRGLAEGIDLSRTKKKKNTVGIVGYFLDRNEGDHKGNIREIRRILGNLGIDVPSVWLEGSGGHKLKEIEEAELIVSFEPFKDAAEIIAAKTGADVLNLDIPFGIEKTKEFVEKISEYFGIECRDALKKELADVIPICRKIKDIFMASTSLSYYGEPYIGKAMHQAVASMGGHFDRMIFLSRKREEIAKYFNLLDADETPNIQFSPSVQDIEAEDSDIHVGCSFFKRYVRKGSFMPFGYPSLETHFLYSHPFLGFRGFIVFLNSLYNSL
jgi:nitrogenase molybdenum-iron protein alpha/beta subunit